MTAKRLLLLLLVLNLGTVASKCNDEMGFRDYGEPAHASDPIVQPYGVKGTVSPAEAAVVRGLIPNGSQPDSTGVYYFAQPQSRRAIISRLGFPGSYAGNSDYYQMEQGQAEIIYNAEGSAIGVRRAP